METPVPFNPQSPRYTDRRFPAYRFIQGITPHPRRDPKGYSYGQPESQISFLPPEQWRQNEEYLYGIDLYNFNYWWEAHEAWELVWKTTGKTDDQGRLLQGLIQISAGMIKWWAGYSDGMRKLFREGVEKIQSLPEPHFMGLDLLTFINAIRQFQKQLRPQNYPFIHLFFNKIDKWSCKKL